jgi:hypothetical protein
MKKCLVELSDASAGLGDILVIMPYLERFRTSYDFELYFMLKNVSLSKLFAESFPNIHFIPLGSEIDCEKHIKLVHKDHSLPLQQIFAKQLGFVDAPISDPL